MTRPRSKRSHQSSKPKSETWLTPPELICALGAFDLDPCGAPDPRPWPTARVHYVLPQDGLALPWDGRVWLNPPFTQPAVTAWMQRMARHGCGMLLVNTGTETAAVHDHVFDRAHAIYWFRGRLRFHYPDGRPAPFNAGAASMLAAYGVDDADRLASLTADGVLRDIGMPGRFDPLRLARHYAVAVLALTWSETVAAVLAREGGAVRLSDLYLALARHPKAKANPTYQATIRRTLQQGGFRRVGRGMWAARDAA